MSKLREEIVRVVHPYEEIQEMIDEVVIPYPKPAVYISGGIDSTILLHHLKKKTDELIHTYTYGFKDDINEFKNAEKVAKHYGTNHTKIMIENFTGRFPEILRHIDRPRFNLQMYWLAEKAQEDGCKTCYMAEGLDEHFGGYWYKQKLGYMESFADHYVWICPTHQQIHKIFGLRCEIPFSNLEIKRTIKYWDLKREKEFLRIAYQECLPDFVVKRRKNPGRPNWRNLWNRELRHIFPDKSPNSDEEIRHYLNKYTIAIWQLVND